MFDLEIRDILKQGLAKTGGIIMGFPTREKAKFFRDRLYRFRMLDRLPMANRHNRLPDYGDSIFDPLSFKMLNPEPGRFFVRIYKKWSVPTLHEEPFMARNM